MSNEKNDSKCYGKEQRDDAALFWGHSFGSFCSPRGEAHMSIWLFRARRRGLQPTAFLF